MYTIGSFKNYQWADFGFNQSYNGLTYTNVASNGISWEIAKKHDIGLDLVLFNERFSLTVDYFNEKEPAFSCQEVHCLLLWDFMTVTNLMLM